MTTTGQDPSLTSPSRKAWEQALAALRDAEAAFRPILDIYSEAEHAWFAIRDTTLSSEQRDEELAIAYARIDLDRAYADEHRYGHTLHETAKACFHTQAPHLAAIIEKVEMIERIGYDGSVEQLILADLRRLVVARTDG